MLTRLPGLLPPGLTVGFDIAKGNFQADKREDFKSLETGACGRARIQLGGPEAHRGRGGVGGGGCSCCSQETGPICR